MKTGAPRASCHTLSKWRFQLEASVLRCDGVGQALADSSCSWFNPFRIRAISWKFWASLLLQSFYFYISFHPRGAPGTRWERVKRERLIGAALCDAKSKGSALDAKAPLAQSDRQSAGFLP